jgi:hypothetical protein
VTIKTSMTIGAMEAATEIMRTYSNGSLPVPGYVTVSGIGTINFLVNSKEEVYRWGQSVDKIVNVHEVTTDRESQTHYTTHFTHDIYPVEVFFVQHNE